MLSHHSCLLNDKTEKKGRKENESYNECVEIKGGQTIKTKATLAVNGVFAKILYNARKKEFKREAKQTVFLSFLKHECNFHYLFVFNKKNKICI